MFDENKKRTTLGTPVDADVEQFDNLYNDIISQEVFDSNYLYTISMTELFETTYKAKIPVVDDFLYAGTYLFAGSPKVGKSFFMAQIAYNVSMGLDMWNYKTRQGKVLYFALEDDYARLQNRLSTMFGLKDNENLYLATFSEKIGNGLEEQIERFIMKHPSTKLIIIDTLQKIKQAEKFSYGNDYKVVADIKKLSDKYQICILLVHHTRKQGAEDSFDMISGSNGLLGASDGAFVLQKEKRFSDIATLEMVGRDQQDQKLHLKFNRETCLWEFTKAEAEVLKQPKHELILRVTDFVLQNDVNFAGKPAELLELLKEEKTKPNYLSKILNINAEILQNEYGIIYENTRTRQGSFIKLTIDENFVKHKSDDVTMNLEILGN